MLMVNCLIEVLIKSRRNVVETGEYLLGEMYSWSKIQRTFAPPANSNPLDGMTISISIAIQYHGLESRLASRAQRFEGVSP